MSFWPSEQEMCESERKNLYLDSLTEFYQSLEQFRIKLEKHRILYTLHNYKGVQGGKRVHAAFPPLFPELLFAIGVPTNFVLLYELLRLWVKMKNGRKLRVRFGDIEVEATQLSVEQFEKLMKIVEYHEKKRIEKITNMKSRNLEKIFDQLGNDLMAKLESEDYLVRDYRKREHKKLIIDEKAKLRKHFNR